MSSIINKRKGTEKEAMNVEILDEAEQEKVIQELKRSASDQVQFNRSMFAVVFGIIAGIFLICAFYTVRYPWEMEHQRHFKEILPTWAFICYYLLSSICFFIAAFTVKVNFFPPNSVTILNCILIESSAHKTCVHLSGLRVGSWIVCTIHLAANILSA